MKTTTKNLKDYSKYIIMTTNDYTHAKDEKFTFKEAVENKKR